jgi:hypothetical protein
VFQNTHDWNVILSPDFSMYIDIDMEIDRFVIKDCLKQNHIYTIPKEVMWHEHKFNIKEIFNRFAWVDNSHFKFITKDGIERLFNIKEPGFKEEKFSVFPTFDEAKLADNHYYLSPQFIDPKDQIEWMNRKLEEFFSAMYLQAGNEMSEPHEDEALVEKLKLQIYPKIFTVFWGQKQTKFRNPIMASLPFTFVDWKTMELMKEGKFDIDELNFKQIQKLCLNIVPGLQTFPQYLAYHGDSIESFIQMTLQRLEDNQQNPAVEVPTIPFCRNIWGKTSLHILAEMGDAKHANEILKILGQSLTHHHSMDISDILGWMIEESIPNVGMYFSSRLIQTEATKAISKGTLKIPDVANITTSKITMNEESMREKLFEKNENNVEGRVLV